MGVGGAVEVYTEVHCSENRFWWAGELVSQYLGSPFTLWL